jgi:septal ring factor EnvC (AmiA/AmiB activator)
MCAERVTMPSAAPVKFRLHGTMKRRTIGASTDHALTVHAGSIPVARLSNFGRIEGERMERKAREELERELELAQNEFAICEREVDRLEDELADAEIDLDNARDALADAEAALAEFNDGEE